MITDTHINYPTPSRISYSDNQTDIALSHQAELPEIDRIPSFFKGYLIDPATTAKCLMLLSKVVRTSFLPIAPSLRDPIVSAGSDQLRFEAFSSCNGVYARLDLLESAVEGHFVAEGTTNVDFNDPILNALSRIQKNEKVALGIGRDEVTLETGQEQVTEKKVKLPVRWIKGLTTVQLSLAEMKPVFVLNKLQSMQLLQALPKGQVKGEFYIINRANKFVFTPIASAQGIRIGGIQRLQLLATLLPFCDELRIFQSNDDAQSACFVADLGCMRFTLAYSPDLYRGFSGEGKVLDSLINDPLLESADILDWLEQAHTLLSPNQAFIPSLLEPIKLPLDNPDGLTQSLSSMGLLGYDLYQEQHYFRRLPFKMENILAFNPRLKNAKQLVDDNHVTFISKEPDKVIAEVRHNELSYRVTIDQSAERCTCLWYSKYQGKRGVCKHVLAVKMLSNR
ncbi:SWIM zinc finger domain-containing protein [Entomomonas sp. E2T0]|uniref:SWIM zinc finger family protein n=1 Tax=Entomomonas sp. E2T0 TaxID=2930213 RepID=UPI0022284F23|nr:SWIM zinc finger family protein [Entomomonas sp. E2T0]UYZ83133.1 SWIM zinc finger domain-containing protein [Entomomonas sp. E2T0]